MLLEIPQTLTADQPRGSRPRPLAAFHPLILEVCLVTRTFPRAEPLELGAGLRNAALAAAEAVLQSCRCPDPARAAALAAAAGRLRELGCCLEIARRLGYLQTFHCAGIASLVAGAHDSLSRQAARPTVQAGDTGRPAAQPAVGGAPSRSDRHAPAPVPAAPVPLQTWAARTRRAGSLSQ